MKFKVLVDLRILCHKVLIQENHSWWVIILVHKIMHVKIDETKGSLRQDVFDSKDTMRTFAASV